MTDIASSTMTGTLDMTRTTGAPLGRRFSTKEVLMPAAKVITVSSLVTCSLICDSRDLGVLRLGHEHQDVGPADGFDVVERRSDAVLARQLLRAFLTTIRDHDLVRGAPARADQTRR